MTLSNSVHSDLPSGTLTHRSSRPSSLTFKFGPSFTSVHHRSIRLKKRRKKQKIRRQLTLVPLLSVGERYILKVTLYSSSSSLSTEGVAPFALEQSSPSTVDRVTPLINSIEI